MRIFVIKRKS